MAWEIVKGERRGKGKICVEGGVELGQAGEGLVVLAVEVAVEVEEVGREEESRERFCLCGG